LPVTLIVSWNPLSGAATYHLQVATNSSFTTRSVDDSLIATTSDTIGPLQNNTIYYWRLRGRNTGGWGNWSSLWSFQTIPGTPVAPVLASPSDNASNQPTTITLSWNASPGAATYRLQVAASSSFVGPVFDDSSLAGLSQQVGSLANTTSYYWRVSAKNAGGTSDWSVVRKFTTVPPLPGAPALFSPSNGATNVSTSPVLSWNTSLGATSYRLQVSTVSTFLTTVFDSSGMVTTSYATGSLSNSTTYYWRVNATNVAGTTDWSEVWSFTTAPAAPGVPLLSAPSDGAINLPTTVTATWNASAGAINYRLQLAVNSSFALPLLDDSSLTATSRLLTSLANNTEYYWRVGARNSGGWSAWSSVWSFTTVSTIPPVPLLVSPQDGAANQPTTVSINWRVSASASTYRLQLSTSPSFGLPIINDSTLTDTSRSVGPLSNNTTYYWRVSAKNAGGTSEWSNAREFATISAPPASPSLASPLNAAADQSTSVTVRWDPSPGATSYRLQVSTSSSFATTAIDDSTITGTSRQIGQLFNSTTYYWHVNAANAGGRSAWSTAWNFSTVVATPAEPTLTSPLNGSVNQSSTLTLLWNASTGSDGYHLQLSNSTSFITRLIDDSTLTGTSRQVGPLSNNTIFYWRTRAKNAGGWSNWSETWGFATGSTAPLPPTLSDPPNNSVNQPLSPTLTWNSTLGVTSYHLQVSSSSNFGNMIFNDSAVTGTSQVIGPLAYNTRYYWRASASYAVLTSGWSETWTFTTIPAVPAAPGLLTPANGASNQATTVTCSWSVSAGATSYRLQVSASSTFSSTLLDDSTLTAVSRQVGPLTDNTTCYWRVNARNVTGTSPWSTVWSFTTLPSSSGIPTASTDSPSGVAQSSAILHGTVNPGGQVLSVKFQYGLTNAYDNEIVASPGSVSDTDPVPVSASLNGLSVNTMYHYRVVARSTTDSAYGQDKTFKTLAPGYPQTLSLSTTVAFPTYENRSDFKATDYRIVGLPGAVNSPVATMLPGSSGSDWQMFWDNGSASDYLIQFDGGPDFRFTTGRAFWLIKNGSWSVNTTVQSAPLDSSGAVKVPLHPGWNLIANPFSSPVHWSSIQSANSITEQLYAYAGNFNASSDFNPYTGYYFFNATNLQALSMPYAATFDGSSASNSPDSVKWRVVVELSTSDGTDNSTWFGVSSNADDGLDKYDLHKPRGITSMPSVFFDRPEWDSKYHWFAADVRFDKEELYQWDIGVDLIRRDGGRLILSGVKEIPSFLEVYLVDKNNGAIIDLRKQSEYNLPSGADRRELSVVVGRKDLITGRLKSIRSPSGYMLGENYPNPFNPSTTIPVTISQRSEIVLTIYDILGREIREIYRGLQNRGEHVFSWDGKNRYNAQALSGTYIVRLVVNNGLNLSRKMILLK
jgi:transposase-like protein